MGQTDASEALIGVENAVENEDRMLTIKDMEKKFSVTGQTIWRWINKKKMMFPTHKIGGGWYWRESDLNKWLDENNRT